jgi:hypothetical protein
MVFTKRLREPIMSGEVTCSIRIWRSSHVKVGGLYRLGVGFIEVTSIRRITLADVTPELAKRSGFAGVVDLLKVAKHGAGRESLSDRVRIPSGRYHVGTEANALQESDCSLKSALLEFEVDQRIDWGSLDGDDDHERMYQLRSM